MLSNSQLILKIEFNVKYKQNRIVQEIKCGFT
jgi:hypothetical protein